MSNKKIVPPPMKKSVLLKAKLKAFAAKLKQPAQTAVAVMLIASGIGYIAVKTPEIHGQFLRAKVGSKVYKIQGRLDGGGGTGFSVVAPSGKTYIVTNSHVCEGALSQSEDKTALLVVNDAGSMRRKIIENSDFTDLCLLEGLPGEDGLSLGNAPGLGEHSYIVGHPLLRPLSIAAGETVGLEDVAILAYVMPGNPMIDHLAPQMVKEGKCDLPKNKRVDLETMFGPVSLCLNVTYNAYNTTITIYPGNSGSPMVDTWGRVQGVAFAGDGDTTWGRSVSLADLKKFLARY